jgi:hypothetical protein
MVDIMVMIPIPRMETSKVIAEKKMLLHFLYRMSSFIVIYG